MTRLEWEKAQHPMREQPKGEVVFSKKLTLRELLSINPTEEDEAKNLLSDVPFNFEVRDLGKSFLNIVSFPERQPLTSNDLYHLLQVSKPGGRSRRGQRPEAIDADWEIILPRVRQKSPEAERLYNYHKKYIPEFSEFEENHFKFFWRAIHFGIESINQEEELNKQFKRFIDERELLDKYGLEYFKKIPLSRIFANRGYTEGELDFLKTKGFVEKHDKHSGPEPREFFASIGKEVDEEIKTELGEYIFSNREKAIEFAAHQRLHSSDVLSIAIDSRGQFYSAIKMFFVQEKVVDGKKQKTDITIRYFVDSLNVLGDGQIEIKKGESGIRISLVKGGEDYFKPKLEEFNLVAPRRKGMSPLIVWEKDKATGRKIYNNEGVDEFPKHDTLLGQLVVSAYSPQVRDQMPLEIKMKGADGGQRIQPMLEAQTVILVPMFANKFLTQSPVILGLEQLASKGK